MKILTLWTAFLFVFSVSADKVRHLFIDDNKIHPISLKLGYSTLLRFEDKPQKVVIGNQNFFDVEFIENDLTIRPLGEVETNLFVYTKKKRFGFLIQVSSRGRSDSLIKIRWRPFLHKKTRPKIILLGLKAKIVRMERMGVGKYFADIWIKDRSKVEVTSSNKDLKVVQGRSGHLRVFFTVQDDRKLIFKLHTKK